MTILFHSNPARARMEAAGRAFAQKKLAAQEMPSEQILPRAKASKEWERNMADAASEAEQKLHSWRPWPSLANVLDEVADRTGISRVDILSHRRNFKIVAARHECFWLARQRTTFSLPQIGRFFGNRDHTTVMHGIQKHEQRMQAAEVPFS